MKYSKSDVQSKVHASPTVGRNILERLQQISQPYRTEIVIEDNVGVLRFQDEPDKNASHK